MDTYLAPLQDTTTVLRGAPSPVKANEECIFFWAEFPNCIFYACLRCVPP